MVNVKLLAVSLSVFIRESKNVELSSREIIKYWDAAKFRLLCTSNRKFVRCYQLCREFLVFSVFDLDFQYLQFLFSKANYMLTVIDLEHSCKEALLCVDHLIGWFVFISKNTSAMRIQHRFARFDSWVEQTVP